MEPAIGSEVDDKTLLDFPVETADVVLTKKSVVGLALGEIIKRAQADFIRGVGVKKIVRAGADLPLASAMVLARGDVLTLGGIPESVARVAAEIGYVDRPTNTTEMALIAAGVFIGGTIGIPALRLGDIELGLSQSVGVLLGGRVFGWLRLVNRRVPRLPAATVWLFDSFGLTAFLAVTALTAGPDFVKGLQKSGVSLVAAGLALVILPQLITLLAGKFVFHMHPGILLGVCCGAGTSAPALAAVQEPGAQQGANARVWRYLCCGQRAARPLGSVIVALIH
jgi:putative transport protein